MKLVAVAFSLLCVSSCSATEQDASCGSGLVVRLPLEWVAERAEGVVSWSGPEGGSDWRTTINVHSTPIRTDEVIRSVEAVAKALLTRYAHMGARTRLARGERVAGEKAVRIDIRFEHAGTDYRRRQLVFQHGGRIVHLDATAPSASWDRVEPVVERAVESARWEDT